MLMLNRRTAAFVSQILMLVIGLAGGLLLATRLLPASSTSPQTTTQQVDTPQARAPQPDSRANSDPSDRETPRATLERKLREWNLDPNTIIDELERAGRILREKGEEARDYVQGEWPDVRIIATIKGRLILDRDLDAWHITVGCENGHVTLSGVVDSPEQISRAIVLALDTDGVLDVDSRLVVRPSPNTPGPQRDPAGRI